MERNNSNNIFLPSGCISLEGLQAYREGLCSKEVSEQIAGHLKNCRFCSEAYEGLALIPGKYEQKARLRSLRSDLKKRIHARQSTESGITYFSKKINLVALAASVLFLAGIFSIYSYLLKRDRTIFAVQEEVLQQDTVIPVPPSIPGEVPITGIQDKSLTSSSTMGNESNKKSVNKIPGPKSEANQKGSFLAQSDSMGFRADSVSDLTATGDEVFITQLTEEKTLKNKQEAEPATIIPAGEQSLEEPVALARKARPAGMTVKSLTAYEKNKESFQPARFQKEGYLNFQDYLRKHLVYPDSLINRGVHGTVLIECVITAEGKLQNGRILKRLNPALDQQALQTVIQSSPWIPATLNGQPFEQKVVIPVEFK